jgi:hypothetical protein
VTIETWNDWAQDGVVIKGVAHNWTIRGLVVDPGIRVAFAHDTVGLRVDPGTGDNGLDNGGAYSWSIEDYSVSVRRGGYGAFMDGRFLYANMRDLTSGKGTNGTPLIKLVNSGGVTVEGLTTEGWNELYAVWALNSRGLTFRDFSLGTPNTGGWTGVLLENTSDSSLKDWVVWPGKLEWDDVGATRVALTGSSVGNRLDILVGDDGYSNDGGENPENVVKVLAPGNEVLVTNVRTRVTLALEYKNEP